MVMLLETYFERIECRIRVLFAKHGSHEKVVDKVIVLEGNDVQRQNHGVRRGSL